MSKNIGISRFVRIDWLDAAATLRAETSDPAEIRARLDPIVGESVQGIASRRKAIDVLLNVWHKSERVAPDLHAEAVERWRDSEVAEDRLCLHYGLTIVYYPYFRRTMAEIGRVAWRDGTITTARVRARLAAEIGEIGSLTRALDHQFVTLKSLGILAETTQPHVFVARTGIAASSPALEAWLLACALRSHPAEELPFADLVRLPELFPFRISLGIEQLRGDARFAIHRQGIGMDMVRAAIAPSDAIA